MCAVCVYLQPPVDTFHVVVMETGQHPELLAVGVVTEADLTPAETQKKSVTWALADDVHLEEPWGIGELTVCSHHSSHSWRFWSENVEFLFASTSWTWRNLDAPRTPAGPEEQGGHGRHEGRNSTDVTESSILRSKVKSLRLIDLSLTKTWPTPWLVHPELAVDHRFSPDLETWSVLNPVEVQLQWCVVSVSHLVVISLRVSWSVQERVPPSVPPSGSVLTNQFCGGEVFC